MKNLYRVVFVTLASAMLVASLWSMPRATDNA